MAVINAGTNRQEQSQSASDFTHTGLELERSDIDLIIKLILLFRQNYQHQMLLKVFLRRNILRYALSTEGDGIVCPPINLFSPYSPPVK
jgi:hypothetical protein